MTPVAPEWRAPRGIRTPTASSVAWCSASIWSAPAGSGLLTLQASSIWSDPDRSRRIVGMIKRMIKQAKQLGPLVERGRRRRLQHRDQFVDGAAGCIEPGPALQHCVACYAGRGQIGARLDGRPAGVRPMSRSEQLFEQGSDALLDLLQERRAFVQGSLVLLYVRADDPVDPKTDLLDQLTELFIEDLGAGCGHPPVVRSHGHPDRFFQRLFGFADLLICLQCGLPVGGDGVGQREDGVTLKASWVSSRSCSRSAWRASRSLRSDELDLPE
jgi:hypothetical protein